MGSWMYLSEHMQVYYNTLFPFPRMWKWAASSVLWPLYCRCLEVSPCTRASTRVCVRPTGVTERLKQKLQLSPSLPLRWPIGLYTFGHCNTYFMFPLFLKIFWIVMFLCLSSFFVLQQFLCCILSFIQFQTYFFCFISFIFKHYKET